MNLTAKGQSLFEVVFTIAIAAIMVTGIVTLSTTSIRNSTYARNKATATRHIQEASEWLRGQRDNDWDSLSALASAGGSDYCLAVLIHEDLSSFTSSATCVVINGTIFTRTINLSLNSDVLEADITVSWSDSQGSHSSNSVTRLANWKS